MEGPFKVEVFPTWQHVEPRWLRLQEQGFGTPFQQAQWLAPWYAVFGETPGIEPVLVAVSERRSGDDIMLIPLIRRTVGATRTIEFADLGVTDYNAPLIDPRAPSTRENAVALWLAVRKALPGADLLRFAKMPAEIRGIKNPLALVDDVRPSEVTGHVIALPEAWDEYLASLKKDVRSLLKRRWRRFSEKGSAGLHWIDNEEEARRALATLQAQQTQRLRSRGIRHLFDQPSYARFYERYVADGLARGAAVLTALVAENRTVAIFLAVADRHRCILIRSSQCLGPEWAALGLGKLIIERSMQALHARGYRCFDLSIGDYPYKHDFGVAPVPLVDLNVARTWRGLPIVYRDRTVAFVKRSPRAASFARSLQRTLFPRLPADCPSS
jgi:CelD/BcsL family acetyltransferase involved in cellulose biosynthesis